MERSFVQDPYPFYAKARADGPVLWWEDYAMLAVFDAATIQALLRDKRLGRARPEDQKLAVPAHLAAFDALERFSMLDMEPPAHTKLRAQVLRAFTSRQIAGLAPQIEDICDQLIAEFPDSAFDLIPAFCAPLPVRIIARLLGVPEERAPDLLRWSNTMVAMYQAGKTRATEEAANTAAKEFTAFLQDHIADRRSCPADDLISHLIAVGTLSAQEIIGTAVLLLNAGHEATVHSLGNAVKTILEHPTPTRALTPDHIAPTVEEVLRIDPPLHMFTRFAYEDLEIQGVCVKAGEEIALVLGAAGRDPAFCPDPDLFDPFRAAKPHAAFGGGIHFCIGAPLARMEMQIALCKLFANCPDLRITKPPHYANSYHFHKLDHLMVQLGT